MASNLKGNHGFNNKAAMTSENVLRGNQKAPLKLGERIFQTQTGTGKVELAH